MRSLSNCCCAEISQQGHQAKKDLVRRLPLDDDQPRTPRLDPVVTRSRGASTAGSRTGPAAGSPATSPACQDGHGDQRAATAKRRRTRG